MRNVKFYVVREGKGVLLIENEQKYSYLSCDLSEKCSPI
jgi:hypothetical protein